MRNIRPTGAVLDPRVDLDIKTGAVEPASPSCGKWSSVERLNCMFKVLLGAAETLLKAAESQIEAP